MEGTAVSTAELKKKLPSTEKVASIILAGVAKGDSAICESFESGLLWANMIGPLPERGLGFIGTIPKNSTTSVGLRSAPTLLRHGYSAPRGKPSTAPAIATSEVRRTMPPRVR